MKKRNGNVLYMAVITWCPLAIASHNQIVVAVWIAAMITVLVLQVRSYIKGDPQEERERRLQRSRERTTQLESELGLEPLKLEELDDILLNNDPPGKGNGGA